MIDSHLKPAIGLGRLYGRDLDTTALSANHYFQTLAPNDVVSARWQRQYQEYFGFIFVHWEKVQMCRPSFFFLPSLVQTLMSLSVSAAMALMTSNISCRLTVMFLTRPKLCVMAKCKTNDLPVNLSCTFC